MESTMDPQRTAIVTGAASGLGRSIAVALGRRGWRVALADVNDAGSEETLTLVRQAGGDGQVEHLDVTSWEAWRGLRDKLRETWPRLDLLVNNAGVSMGGDVGQLPLEDWEFIININVYGPIYGCHTMIDWMKLNSRGAHIVNVASLAAIASAPGMAAYNVTKAGVLALSETLYSELKPHNIGVTVVCPDFFATNICHAARFQTNEQKRLAHQLMKETKLSADDVAARVMRAIDRKRLYVFVPTLADLIWRLKRLMPVVALNIVARHFAKKYEALPAEEVLAVAVTEPEKVEA
jgi:NAD(P)-dependent dehydrogenase (short-subunit alcohol dehydrogenase family)